MKKLLRIVSIEKCIPKSIDSFFIMSFISTTKNILLINLKFPTQSFLIYYHLFDLNLMHFHFFYLFFKLINL